jgi:hypothetical protein
MFGSFISSTAIFLWVILCISFPVSIADVFSIVPARLNDFNEVLHYIWSIYYLIGEVRWVQQ